MLDLLLDFNTKIAYIVLQMINRVINKISHSIYKDIEEFKRYNPNTDAKYNWRDGTEGNWVVSDDGQVCQVLKRGIRL